MGLIYMDYNATTPTDPVVLKAMLPYLSQHFGNPSSSHVLGQRARKAVNDARMQVAVMLGCDPDEVVFTSGGTESNNHALIGALAANKAKGDEIITSVIEHPAILEVCHNLENQGLKISYLGVDSTGLVDPDQLPSLMTRKTVILSVMHANNEVGTIQPIAELARQAHEYGILVHSDCAQSVGKIPVRVDELGVDLLTIAGHKIYAPKGIGVLYIRKGTKVRKFIHGAGQEMNQRAGTENVSQIVGLGKACELISNNLNTYSAHMKAMRDRLEHALFEAIPDLRLNGHPDKRLPNTSNIGIKGVQAGEILGRMKKVAASAGAACHAQGNTISSVLAALKVPPEYALGTLRLSVGRFTTAHEVDQAASIIVETVFRQRSRKN
ncbi:aminotransferase class V-fold PLP-dependent enzyme [bacterium]|nr:aminotransferase class V-fold PLP-dependent enzyme [bacterium]